MKYLILFVFAGMLTQTAWEEYISLSGKFKILTPSSLVEQVDTIQTEVGDLAYHTFFHQTSSKEETDNTIFMVSYCDYPEGIIFADSSGLVDTFFEETMQAAAESVDGEILYSTDIQKDDNPGKQWRIDYLDGEAIIRTKAFLVKNRYYSIQTISNKKQKSWGDNNQFFDSFELL